MASKKPVRTRTHQLHIEVNESELAAIDRACALTGYTKSQYIRQLIVGQTIRPLPPVDFLSFAHQLQYIGNNLNQLTRKANALHVIDAQRYDEAIKDLNRLYAAISDALGFEFGG